MDKREELISLFNSIRDIPYSIALTAEEEDNCCSGKSNKLLSILTKKGYNIRWRVCEFNWRDLNLPLEIEEIPHEDLCTHAFLEINIEGNWRTLDPCWDKGLRKTFHVNEWGGKSNTEIAVKPVKILTPKESQDLMKNQPNKSITEQDLKVNGAFYNAFNEYLEKERMKVEIYG